MLVPINIALRSAATWKNVIYHSAYSEPDNCYPDYARQNADDLAEMLRAQGTVGRSALCAKGTVRTPSLVTKWDLARVRTKVRAPGGST